VESFGAERTFLFICAIKSSVFAVETKKHNEIKVEDFKGLSAEQLDTLSSGAKFLFSPPDPSKATPKSKPNIRISGEMIPEE
jgi:hypothetical protein